MNEAARAERLKTLYGLEAHPEGGSFSEVYTSPASKEGRPLAGSIYFLLGPGEISHLHQIDCDEIWYYHEGCGMRITVLTETGKAEYRLGPDAEHGARAMVVIPAGAMFAAENLTAEGYTFVSCATVPKFRYQGFRMIAREELSYPELDRLIL